MNAAGKTQTELNQSLESWISATNARDVERQMTYYSSNVNAFYLARNASLKTVQAEKTRVFGDATRVNMAAGKPEIVLSANGQIAKMRFRKKYSIKTVSQNRTGEVLQELRWQKSNDGWKIIGERDLKVIAR